MPQERPPFPSLDDLIRSLDVVIQTLRSGCYFFGYTNGGDGSREYYEGIEQLNLVRSVIGGILPDRPTLADYPLEIARDVIYAANDEYRSVRWVKRQLYALATTKSSGKYEHKYQLITFLRNFRRRVKETQRYSLK